MLEKPDDIIIIDLGDIQTDPFFFSETDLKNKDCMYALPIVVLRNGRRDYSPSLFSNELFIQKVFSW